MKLFTKSQLTKLLQNGSPENRGKNHKPVVKLFTPDAQCTWLISEIDPENPDIAFGLCDLGMGYPELGCVSIAELEALRGKLGLPVERDLLLRANSQSQFVPVPLHIMNISLMILHYFNIMPTKVKSHKAL